jgi:hypothetical protein
MRDMCSLKSSLEIMQDNFKSSSKLSCNFKGRNNISVRKKVREGNFRAEFQYPVILPQTVFKVM